MTSPSDDLTAIIEAFRKYLNEYAETITDEDYERLRVLHRELTDMLPGTCTCGSTDGFHDEECIEANA
jgi:hypothetical protein